MSSNMSSTNNRYEDAAKKYETAVNQYTGNAGFQNSLQQAKQGAGVEAVQAGNRAQTQARSAGMSKAAAALMGANDTSNQYLNSFNNQQNNAMNMGNANVQARNNQMSAGMTEGQNAYNRAWGNVGTVANMGGQVVGGIAKAMTMSDERLKHYREVSSKVCKKPECSIKSLKLEIKKND